MKISLLCGLAIASTTLFLPLAAIAQKKPYPQGIQAYFLTGCVNDQPPKVVTQERLKLCLCMLELVQDKFAFERFAVLVEASEKKLPAGKEMDQFLEKNVAKCL